MTLLARIEKVLEVRKFKLTSNDSYALGKKDMLADVLIIIRHLFAQPPTDEEVERVGQAMFHYATDKMPPHISDKFGWPFGVTHREKETWRDFARAAITAYRGS